MPPKNWKKYSFSAKVDRSRYPHFWQFSPIMTRYNKRRNSSLSFGKLSLRRQRDAFVRLRWQILGSTPLYGSMLTSHQILDEPGRPPIYNQWFDFLFLGMDGHTIWNAEIITGRQAFWDQVDDLAWEQTQSLLKEQEFQAEFCWRTVPAPSVGGQKLYRVIRPEPCHYASLDGLTVQAYQERTASEILKNSPPDVHESFGIDRSHRYGVGLHIVLDVPVIDRRAVENAIVKFREEDETEWESAAPIRRSRLPDQTEAETMAEYRAHPR